MKGDREMLRRVTLMLIDCCDDLDGRISLHYQNRRDDDEHYTKDMAQVRVARTTIAAALQHMHGIETKAE